MPEDPVGTKRVQVAGLSVVHLPARPLTPSPHRVVLLHGWESAAAQLLPLGLRLQEAGAEVFLIDAPAHGQSPGAQANPVVFAEALRSVQQAIGPIDTVIGHSMGGGALLIALHDGLQAARAITIAAPANIEAVLRRFAKHLGLAGRAETAFLADVERHVGRTFAQVSARCLAPAIRQPVLIVHDRDDREIPAAEATELASLLPAGRLLLTERLGHRRILCDDALHQRLANDLFVTGHEQNVKAAKSRATFATSGSFEVTTF